MAVLEPLSVRFHQSGVFENNLARFVTANCFPDSAESPSRSISEFVWKFFPLAVSLLETPRRNVCRPSPLEKQLHILLQLITF